jgi:FkbM family methyltransferase
MSQEPILSPGSVPRISYAPNNEDILLDRIFGDHVGTFLDVGASRPCRDNLTYFFYCRGWRGVNLEPVPRRHRAFQATRPGDMNLPLAAWDSNGAIPFFEIAAAGSDGDGLATFSTRLAEQHRAGGATLIEGWAAVRTIRSLVEELHIDPPDFITINAEGSEEPVIRGIPLEHWRPGVFVVAANWPHTAMPSHQGWEPVLLEHGYLLAACNGVNRFYLRDDLRHLRARLDLPVSALDRFQRAEVVTLEQQVRVLEQESLRWQSDADHWRELCGELDRRHADNLGMLRAEARLREELETRLAQAEQRCSFWERDSARLRRDLAATQRTLRPYRLIDQLGVVTIGYRLARRLKPNRAS